MKKHINLIYILTVLFCVLLTYSNHFNNPFEFDDSHSIQSNEAISKLDVVRFFTDASCLTALPSNQSYRPFTVLLNSIDYQISEYFNKDPKFKDATFISVCAFCRFRPSKLGILVVLSLSPLPITKSTVVPTKSSCSALRIMP